MPVKAFRAYENEVLIRVSGGRPHIGAKRGRVRHYEQEESANPHPFRLPRQQGGLRRGIGLIRGISGQIAADVRVRDYEKTTNDER